MPRFEKCPQCLGEDIEIIGYYWTCWDCEWEEEINTEERGNGDA